MDFDDFCSFFECHFILAEKQQTKQTNFSSLSLSASLDTQDIFQDGMIVEWKKFWQEIPVWVGSHTRLSSQFTTMIKALSNRYEKGWIYFLPYNRQTTRIFSSFTTTVTEFE